MTFDDEVDQLSEEIGRYQDVACALGSETRLHLIQCMIAKHRYEGLRVEEIVSDTNLSRPAVSHHLQILKRAGIVKMRREGTRNYYYFDADAERFDGFIRMLTRARALMRSLPADRNDCKPN